MITRAFLYRWTHLPSGMWYEGSHTKKGCHPDNGYICSSSIVKSMIKSNPADWFRQILVIGSPSYIRQLENKRLVSLDAANNPMSFNRDHGNGAEGFCSTGKTWINNENIEILIHDNALTVFLSLGWKEGRKQSIKKMLQEKNRKNNTGENNSAWGKKWMTDGLTNRLVSLEEQNDFLIRGWKFGVKNSTINIISNNSKNYYVTRSEDQANTHKKNLSNSISNYHANLTEEEYSIRSKKCSIGTKEAYNKKSKEEKDKQNSILNGIKKQCPNCGIVTARGNYVRWGHGENCKKLSNKE